jgi:hypothetical protein
MACPLVTLILRIRYGFVASLLLRFNIVIDSCVLSVRFCCVLGNSTTFRASV